MYMLQPNMDLIEKRKGEGNPSNVKLLRKKLFLGKISLDIHAKDFKFYDFEKRFECPATCLECCDGYKVEYATKQITLVRPRIEMYDHTMPIEVFYLLFECAVM